MQVQISLGGSYDPANSGRGGFTRVNDDDTETNAGDNGQHHTQTPKLDQGEKQNKMGRYSYKDMC